MYCPNCGKENPDQAQFCSNCGFNLKSNVKTSEKVEASPHINVSPMITASGGEEAKVEFAPNITVSSRIKTEIRDEKIGSIGEVLSEGAIKTGDIGMVKGAIGSADKLFTKCPYCGEALNFPKPPKYCPYCGEELRLLEV